MNKDIIFFLRIVYYCRQRSITVVIDLLFKEAQAKLTIFWVIKFWPRAELPLDWG